MNGVLAVGRCLVECGLWGLSGWRPAAENAELVALRVGKNDPRHIPLPDVDIPGAQGEKALDLVGLIVRSEIQMEPILSRFGFGYPDEDDSWRLPGMFLDFELLGVFVHHRPAEGSSPPSPQAHRVGRVDYYLLPPQRHGYTVGLDVRARAGSP